jgi:N-acetylmuramoyl-L-alanine amidase
MKKWLSLLFVVASMLFLSSGLVHAAKAVELVPKLVLDGKMLAPQVPPTVIGKTVMIPVRIATENLGYKVDYDNKKKQVTVSSSTKQLVMTLDKSTAFLDSQPQQMDVPPTLKSQNILIPLRFLGDSLNVEVLWDNQTKSAFLYSSNDPVVPPAPTIPTTPTAPTEPGVSDGGGLSETSPPEGGLIGIVDENNNTDGGGTLPGTDGVVTPPVTIGMMGYVHEARYEPDAVVIKYEGFLTPNVSMLDNPKRLVIDLPNADFASDFLPALPTDPALGKQGEIAVTDHAALTKIRYSLYADQPKTLRFVLDLSQPWDYELVNDPTIGELRILLKQPVPDKSLFTVVLDAGHGGSDPGAASINKHWEKDFNLAVILKVRDLLATDSRIKLVLTRSDDSFPSLKDRYSLANSVGADLFVSVHANSYTAATNGTETYYTRENSKAFANLMHSLLVPATGLKNNGVRTAGFQVIKYTTMPAVLLEIGYLTSKIDEPQLFSEAFQNRVALAIATGIKQQLKLS